MVKKKNKIYLTFSWNAICKKKIWVIPSICLLIVEQGPMIKCKSTFWPRASRLYSKNNLVIIGEPQLPGKMKPLGFSHFWPIWWRKGCSIQYIVVSWWLLIYSWEIGQIFSGIAKYLRDRQPTCATQAVFFPSAEIGIHQQGQGSPRSDWDCCPWCSWLWCSIFGQGQLQAGHPK